MENELSQAASMSIEPSAENSTKRKRRVIVSSRIAHLFLVAFLIVFLFTAAYFVGSASRATPHHDSEFEIVEGLAIPVQMLDLGEVWEKEVYTLQLPIRNITARTIQVQRFSTSCGCASINPKSLSILPGETVTINASLNLTSRSASEVGLSQRDFGVTIQPVVSNSHPNRSNQWGLHGIIKSRLTVNQLAVHYGSRPIRGQSPVKQIIIVTAHAPCQRLEVEMENSEAVNAKSSRFEDNLQVFQITLSTNPDYQAGKFHTEARIFLVGPNGERDLGSILPIDGEIQDELRVLPSQVYFGLKPIGTTAEAVITMQANGEAKIIVERIVVDDQSTSVEPTSISGMQEGTTFRIRQRIAKANKKTLLFFCPD